ncbi:Glycine betaine/proline betaine-binding periplasmic protein [BD1-7 clade bacterium]|uniref:Glycine betaine/proline betaine-binding periplasmic protein n=1 Tax=BD1-7 clade bacterium TaxID=2029982 RepID=A0A5S9PMG4_9GAMM|nr:Glycine betaine/proline betaine-binding periplasmic protein [BD1-7 clade bacterium]
MRSLFKTLVLAALVSTAQADNALPGKGVTVQPLQSPIAEETFQTVIINKALEALGYKVTPIKEVDYSAAYTSIANGDATYMAVSWFPIHNAMYKNAGGDKVFYREGIYINGAAQGYLIDKKTADKYNITNIADFQNPKIAKLFDNNGDGKADLTGCQAGWGCEAMIEYQLDAYKLRKTVEHNQGQYSAIIADTITRYKVGEPIFYYTWTPYWVSGVLVPGKDVIWLQVPFSATPRDENTTLPNGKNYGFPISSERIVANRKWAEANPAAAKLFAVARLPINDVSIENRLVADGQNSQKDIEIHAQNWIRAHQKQFDSWLTQARAAAK